jgi:hypothetical protein
MADDPKPAPNPPSDKPSDQSPTAASISPAPAEITDAKDGKDKGAPVEDTAASAKAAVAAVQKDPLSDGTVPTVLDTGNGHKSVPKGKASINSIYRRADITTTLFTFVGALVAAGITVGIYSYLTRSKPVTTAPTKVTTLDKSDIEKLGAFFTGNAAGTNSEVLTISASTFFKNRVALGTDAKISGGLQVTGTTALADLTVDKTSTLGVTNVRGSLTITGPLTVQSPTILAAGATVTGNLNATGNGTYGGSISASTLNTRDLSVSGTLNLAGHLSMSGQNPSAAPASSVVSSASVDGNDAGGTVTISMPPVSNQAAGAQLVTVTFRSAYPRAPSVIITPVGRGAAGFQPYVLKTATGFTIGAYTIPANSNATSFAFDYWVVQ